MLCHLYKEEKKTKYKNEILLEEVTNQLHDTSLYYIKKKLLDDLYRKNYNRIFHVFTFCYCLYKKYVTKDTVKIKHSVALRNHSFTTVTSGNVLLHWTAGQRLLWMLFKFDDANFGKMLLDICVSYSTVGYGRVLTRGVLINILVPLQCDRKSPVIVSIFIQIQCLDGARCTINFTRNPWTNSNVRGRLDRFCRGLKFRNEPTPTKGFAM